MSDALDCQRCGACCGPTEDYPTYVDLFAGDVGRLPPRYRLHVIGSSLATKETSSGTVCVALRGSVGKRVSCAIYESRPTLCRRFERGSKACREAREYAGLQ
ncbi:YkgJ family cysteine cluster protein [Sorangium sp. So ce118]